MMDIYKIIGNVALLTIVWMVFAISGYRFIQDNPPHANIMPSQTIEVNGHTLDVPKIEDEDIINADSSLMFMTEESFQRKVEKYNRKRLLQGTITITFGLAVFIIGARLGEHWNYDLACVVFGPLAVTYTGYRRSKFT